MVDIRIGSNVIEAAGDGPAVVMIHGLGGSSNTFQLLMDALDGYRVLRLDLPGAGRSALRPGLNGLPGLMTPVREAMLAAGVTRAHLVGHSMGTLICQYLAAEHPEAVLSLTLYGALLEPPPAARDGLRERAQTARRSGMAGIADSVSAASVSKRSRSGNPLTAAFVRESLMRQDPAGYAAHCEALSSATAAKHAAIRCPTLLVAGEDDPVAPVAMARALQERIDGARLETLPGVGHWMPIEAPERAAALLREHLQTAAG